MLNILASSANTDELITDKGPDQMYRVWLQVGTTHPKLQMAKFRALGSCWSCKSRVHTALKNVGVARMLTSGCYDAVTLPCSLLLIPAAVNIRIAVVQD